MKRISIKDRIALYYLLASAIIMAVVFGFIYFSVQRTVWLNLDSDLSYEAVQHTNEIKINGDTIVFFNKAEWEEREHREPQVNPVFIQLMDSRLQLMDKSPNLKEDVLPIDKTRTIGQHFDGKLKDRDIRLVQVPIKENNVTRGYIVAAMSSESAISVINKLRAVLGITFPFLLGVLFVASRYLAGISIRPIRELTNTATRITRNNLQERLPLPPNRDEIHELAESFNNLLARIERAMERERQFTADASHELRTPLATIRGTLEVLIRKTRSPEEYEEKVCFCLKEIDRLNAMLEQLLQLARMDSGSTILNNRFCSLPEAVEKALVNFHAQIQRKNLEIHVSHDASEACQFPAYYLQLIVDNILSNAVKYTPAGKSIFISIEACGEKMSCTIRDEGLGIAEKDLEHIYDNFFRSEPLSHRAISGNGLGLSIAKKAADAIHATLDLSSEQGKGTTVIISF